MTGKPEKRGAGLLFCCDGHVLLLLRRSNNNDNTWGLPGGNVDDADADLLATAVREATEELGSVPEHNILGSVLTKRGKLNQKHYTVYVAKLSPQVRESYVPTLNEEHRQWRWFPLGEAAVRPDLHPVVGKLLVMHRKELGSILAASSARAP